MRHTVVPMIEPTAAAETTQLYGILAALGTSAAWTFTSLFFTAAGRRIGSTAVNSIRLLIAVVLHMVTFRLITGQWLPDIPSAQLIMLAGSGLIGLTICDQALFTAFIDIGPRLALLAMTTSPIFALIFAFIALDETPGLPDLLGMFVTLAGIAWVILGRDRRDHTTPGRPHLVTPEEAEQPGDDEDRASTVPTARVVRGWTLAIIAAATQALGYMLSKKGMGHGMEGGVEVSPQAATYVRMVFGLLGILPILLHYLVTRHSEARRDQRTRRIGRRSTGLALTLGGAVCGPFIGVWLSLIAADKVSVLGVAQTLCSLAPVLILPFAAFVLKERTGKAAVGGAILAVAGSTILAIF